jgi:error-prone DNA polymerase
MTPLASSYAELHCLSNFSFGRGASSAGELLERARACGYSALAITDECSLAGIVRAYEASKEIDLKLIVGAEFQLDDGPKLVLLCENRQGYTELCKLITRGRRASEKGTYRLTRADMADGLPGTLALWIPGLQPDIAQGRWMRATFGERAWLAVELHRGPDDAARLHELQALGRALELPAATCTCTCAAGSRCSTRSPRSVIACRSPRRAR